MVHLGPPDEHDPGSPGKSRLQERLTKCNHSRGGSDEAPWIRICTGIAGLIGVGSLPGQVQEWPEITLISAERTVFVQPGTEDGSDQVERLNDTGGPWSERVSGQSTGSLGSFADTEAEQDTDISRFFIRGSAEAWGFAQLGGDEDAQVSSIASWDQARASGISPDGRTVWTTGFLRQTADFDGDGKTEGGIQCDNHGDIFASRYTLFD